MRKPPAIFKLFRVIIIMAADDLTTNFLYYKPDNGKALLLPFDADNVRMTPPQAKQGHQKLCSVHYVYNGVAIPLKLQFPRMSTPFELKRPVFGADTKNYLQFSVSFWGEEEREELRAFRKVVNSLDERIIDILTDNSAVWLGTRNRKPKSREIIEDGYGWLIKSGADPLKERQYPDNIPVKVSLRRNTMQAAFFDGDGNTIIDDSMISMAHGEATVIAVLSSVWIVQKYYPKFEAKQVQVFEAPQVDTTYGIVSTKEVVPEQKDSENVFVDFVNKFD